MRGQFIEGVVVEIVGDDILILDSVHHTVHTFPVSYLDTVDALSQGKTVRNRDQLIELENLGLVISGSSGLPRRAVLVGAGALGASLAMPSVAIASSDMNAGSEETFTVADGAFSWGIVLGETKVFPNAAQSETLFAVGTEWTLTVDGVSDTQEIQSGDAGGLTSLTFTISVTPIVGVPLRGRLSGPNGALSNFFDITEGGL